MINSSSRSNERDESVGGFTITSIIDGRPDFAQSSLNSATNFARDSGDSSLRQRTRNFNPTDPISRIRSGSTSLSTAVSVAAPPAGPTSKSAAAINPQVGASTF